MGRWVKYRDGQIRAKLAIELHVEKPLVEWMKQHTTMSEREVLQWIKEQYAARGYERVNDGSFGADEDGTPRFIQGGMEELFEGSVYPG
jgi:hypothetical protein